MPAGKGYPGGGKPTKKAMQDKKKTTKKAKR